MHANVQRVVDAAAALGLEVSPRTFPDGTRTAQEAADAIGVELGQIVKSLIFGVDGEIVLAYVSVLTSSMKRSWPRRLAASCASELMQMW